MYFSHFAPPLDFGNKCISIILPSLALPVGGRGKKKFCEKIKNRLFWQKFVKKWDKKSQKI